MNEQNGQGGKARKIIYLLSPSQDWRGVERQKQRRKDRQTDRQRRKQKMISVDLEKSVVIKYSKRQ